MLPSTVKKKVKKMVSAGVILVRKKQWYQKSFLIAVAALLLLWEGWIYIGPFFPRNFTADYFLHEQFNSTKYVLDLATLVASSQAVTNLRFEQALNSTEFLMGRLTVLEDTTRTLVTQSRFSELANATDLLLQRLKLLEDQFPQAATASQFNQVLNATNLLLQRLEVLEKRCAEVMSTQLDQIRKAANLLLERMKIAEDAGISLQKKLEQQKDSISNTAEKVDQLSRNLEFSIRQSQEVKFLPLNDLERFKVNAEKHGIHGFISEIWGRGDAVGPPEFLYFPSNISHDRLLCIKGNHTKNGTENFYGFAFRESLPSGSVFEPGTTLISNTYWDFTNPWHSMFNLVQFIYWNMHHGCRGANRLLLYHLGELRDSMGSWISNLLLSNHLPWRSDTQIFSGPPVCFEQAVVSRIGIGGVPYFTLQELFKEARCQARRMCNVPFSRTGPSTKKISHVTLMVRERARGYADLSSWEDVVRKSCEKVEGCSWSVMHIANLTFCQQVSIMFLLASLCNLLTCNSILFSIII
ncbi:hypothetical protein O6H91_Y341500 [Diphasiastrum complanatum]|nr:hypothetical protein O6H91_Y341500 [Diphasiastrum complanatum]